MNIRKFITKKNVIIGATVGTAIIGGIVALVVNHNKKKREAEFQRFLDEEDDFDLDDFDEEFWDDDLEDDDEEVCCLEGNRCCEYAEQILRELETGTYSK